MTLKTTFPDSDNSNTTQNYTELHGTTQNYTGRLLNKQAHGEMPTKVDTAALLTLYIQMFCCLNTVNNYE